MLSVVLVPMILAGFLISTRVRRAARAKRASAEMPMPGAMAPPMNSPLAETTSKVVAVPCRDDRGAAEEVEGGYAS